MSCFGLHNIMLTNESWITSKNYLTSLCRAFVYMKMFTNIFIPCLYVYIQMLTKFFMVCPCLQKTKC